MPRKPVKPAPPHVHYVSVAVATFDAGLPAAQIRAAVKEGFIRTVHLPWSKWPLLVREDVRRLGRTLQAQTEGA